jgi:hypothetical protein
MKLHTSAREGSPAGARPGQSCPNAADADPAAPPELPPSPIPPISETQSHPSESANSFTRSKAETLYPTGGSGRIASSHPAIVGILILVLGFDRQAIGEARPVAWSRMRVVLFRTVARAASASPRIGQDQSHD